MTRKLKQKRPIKNTLHREFRERVTRAKPPSLGLYFPKKTARFLSRSDVRAKARSLPKRVLAKELNAIANRRVRPQFSLVQPLRCKLKRAKARREYFGMRAAGKGATRKYRNSNRFTVRC